MTQYEIESMCKAVCSGATHGKCAFKQGVIVGFIDTSAGHDGSRGIAFSSDEMTVKTDGFVRSVFYKNIRSVMVVESYESVFADELIVSGEGFDIRISDYSLDKSELKKLIEGLCESGVSIVEKEDTQKDENQFTDADTESAAQEDSEGQAKNPDALSDEINNGVFEVISDNEFKTAFTEWENEHVFSGVVSEEVNDDPPKEPNGVFEVAREEYGPVFSETPVLSQVGSGESAAKDKTDPQDDRSRESSMEANEKTSESFLTEEFADSFQEDIQNIQEFPGVIPEEEPLPENISASIFEEETAAKILTRVEAGQKEANVMETANNSVNTVKADDDFDEQAELERISSMSHEQTISYLADAFAEINSVPADIREENKAMENALEQVQQTIEKAVPDTKDPEIKKPLQEDTREKLTVEPAWGDIYIKASRSLRELCEQGRLSMDAIREELRVRLLPSAKAFSDITADESKIPKVLMPRITELRSAAKNFDEYFSYGDDIGTRAMFFMLFQMLSYADRIVENHEAKERLNDFFRRFGSAGIILSMLDMRV